MSIIPSPFFLRVQIELDERGFDPGPRDGIWGRLTAGALRAFQTSKNLTPNAVLTPETVKALGLAVLSFLPWMEEIKSKRGLHEVRNWLSLTTWLKSDGATLGDPAKLPWCGDAVQTPIALTLPDEPLPSNPYLAANWTSFGFEVPPQMGCVLVFWRGSPSSWKGHVGFYAGETSTHYLVLGGNQSNSISYVLIAKDRLRKGGSRWPSTFTYDEQKPHKIPDKAARAYVVSVNEA